MIPEPERMSGQALAYARCGWPVFPCQPGGKEPATRHGFRDATTDRQQIASWWRRQPAANVAIATGQPGPDVLDIDQHGPAGNGFTAYRQLRAAELLDGAGAIIAMASDLRIATPQAKTAFLFNRVGLAGCDMGACAILPRIIGQGRAAELLYTGRAMTAQEGELWGFFNKLVAAQAL